MKFSIDKLSPVDTKILLIAEFYTKIMCGQSSRIAKIHTFRRDLLDKFTEINLTNIQSH